MLTSGTFISPRLTSIPNVTLDITLSPRASKISRRTAVLEDKKNQLPKSAAFTLTLADSCFIQTQRLCQWCGQAPSLEEEMAISNIALDTLSYARYLYQETINRVELPETPDTLVFKRDARQYRNFRFIELPQYSFADLVLRNLIFSSFLQNMFQRNKIADEKFYSFSEKAIVEIQYHVDHAHNWIRRLSVGTAIAKQRIQSALDIVWPHTRELSLFSEEFDVTDHLQSQTRCSWHHRATDLLREVGLALPSLPDRYRCGYDGYHTEHLGRLISETQSVYREFPGGIW
ncbi:phenylacetate-CoA oxygenase subunit PaaI [Novacetimonas maltaceti]|nr:phenylacetate-CoA oxygenase subunit PaaI [Novacetimonas maltaceti]